MQVEIRHPAHLRSLRIGARIARDELVAMRTAVDLRAIRPGALEPAGAIVFGHRPDWPCRKGALPVHVHGGVPYVPLHRSDQFEPPTPIEAPVAIAYLRGDLDGLPPRVRQDCADAFQGTPLEDLSGAANMSGGYGDGRGEPVEEARLREIRHDGRPAAAAAVAAFLAGEVVVAGDHLLRRLRPRLHHSQTMGWAIGIGRLNPFLAAPFGHPVDRVEEAEAFAGRSCPPEIRVEAARLAALLPQGDDLDDVRFATACVAAQAARLLRTAARVPGADEARAEAHAFARFHVPLRIGGMADRDLPDAIAAIRRVRHSVKPDERGDDQRVGFGLHYLDKVALPRLAHLTRPDPEDAEAIGALAP